MSDFYIKSNSAPENVIEHRQIDKSVGRPSSALNPSLVGLRHSCHKCEPATLPCCVRPEHFSTGSATSSR
jgi:hypothetical protein